MSDRLKRLRLEPSRMLGFDQIGSFDAVSRTGAKVGGKNGPPPPPVPPPAAG